MLLQGRHTQGKDLGQGRCTLEPVGFAGPDQAAQGPSRVGIRLGRGTEQPPGSWVGGAVLDTTQGQRARAAQGCGGVFGLDSPPREFFEGFGGRGQGLVVSDALQQSSAGVKGRGVLGVGFERTVDQAERGREVEATLMQLGGHVEQGRPCGTRGGFRTRH